MADIKRSRMLEALAEAEKDWEFGPSWQGKRKLAQAAPTPELQAKYSKQTEPSFKQAMAKGVRPVGHAIQEARNIEREVREDPEKALPKEWTREEAMAKLSGLMGLDLDGLDLEAIKEKLSTLSPADRLRALPALMGLGLFVPPTAENDRVKGSKDVAIVVTDDIPADFTGDSTTSGKTVKADDPKKRKGQVA